MSYILPAVQTGIGLARSLFDGRKKNYRPHLDPFRFTPDANDPEIGMRRRAALLDIQRGHAGTVNEIGRAGLLGSSAAFNVLNQNETQGQDLLEGIPDSVYAKQRQDALSLYRDNANFERQLALGEQGYDSSEHMAGLDALGSLGENIGYSYGDPESMSLAAKKKRILAGGGSYLHNNPDAWDY